MGIKEIIFQAASNKVSLLNYFLLTD